MILLKEMLIIVPFKNLTIFKWDDYEDDDFDMDERGTIGKIKIDFKDMDYVSIRLI